MSEDDVDFGLIKSSADDLALEPEWTCGIKSHAHMTKQGAIDCIEMHWQILYRYRKDFLIEFISNNNPPKPRQIETVEKKSFSGD